MRTILRRTALLSGALALTFGARAATDPLEPKLRSDLIFNGFTQSGDGRMFSPFQRQEKNQGIELGEWIDGKPVAYPNAAWNAWAVGADASKAFVGVNAIRMGPDGDLWVLDKGADGMGEAPLPGGAKLVQIDLASNAVRRVYPLDAVVTQKSFLDDFRFNGRRVYLTDAGQPGLVILDLDTGQARRVLDGHPSTKAQRPLTGEGRHLTNEKGRPVYIHADQLEVSPDGKTFYYMPCTGPLYRIATRWLDDASATDAERGGHVAIHARIGSSGGTAIDADGVIYASDADASSVLKILPDGTTTTLIQDRRLVWVDAMWIDDQGGLWLPAAQMNRAKIMNGGASRVEFPTVIYRMAIGARPVRN